MIGWLAGWPRRLRDRWPTDRSRIHARSMQHPLLPSPPPYPFNHDVFLVTAARKWPRKPDLSHPRFVNRQRNP